MKGSDLLLLLLLMMMMVMAGVVGGVTCSRLSVGEDGAVVAFQDIVADGPRTTVVQVYLLCVGVKGGVERERLRRFCSVHPWVLHLRETAANVSAIVRSSTSLQTWKSTCVNRVRRHCVLSGVRHVQ